MRVEPAGRDHLAAVLAAYADARAIQRAQGGVLWPEFSDAARRRLAADPRLPAHYHGIEVALLEEPPGTIADAAAESSDTSRAPRS